MIIVLALPCLSDEIPELLARYWTLRRATEELLDLNREVSTVVSILHNNAIIDFNKFQM